MSDMKRRSLMLWVLVPTLLVGVAIGLLSLDYRLFVNRPLPPNTSEPYFEIPRGASLRQIAEQLVAEGYLTEPYRFLALAHLSGHAGRLMAGEYAWGEGTTPRALLERLATGRVVQHSITLIEGWTFRRVRDALAVDERLTGELAQLTDQQIMARLGRPDQHPEGLFFPDTYLFTRGTPRIQILQRSLERMDQVLAEEWARRTPDLPLATPYEALILASIVEREAALASERAEIAGVFVRRLRIGMRLQADPTVVYGLGDEFEGRLRRVHLRDDNPYNTYVRAGLPPTPIALPGRAAIAATLDPADGETLYFVARGDGSHHFSRTLSEHNQAVRRYILGQE